jgi:hypothetical protein
MTGDSGQGIEDRGQDSSQVAVLLLAIKVKLLTAINLKSAPPPAAQTSLLLNRVEHGMLTRSVWKPAGGRVCQAPFSDPTARSKCCFRDANAERMETRRRARMPSAFFGPDGTE